MELTFSEMLLSKYKEFEKGKISGNDFMEILARSDSRGGYYAYNVLRMDSNLIPIYREVAIDMCKETYQSKVNLINDVDNIKLTSEEREDIFKSLFESDYNYRGLNAILKYGNIENHEFVYIMNNIKKENKHYSYAIYGLIEFYSQIAGPQTQMELLQELVKNIDIFYIFVNNKIFTYDKQIKYAYEHSSELFKKMKRTFKNCMSYCCQFDKYITDNEKGILVDRIIGKKDITSNEIIHINNKFNFSNELREKLNSLMLINELGSFKN